MKESDIRDRNAHNTYLDLVEQDAAVLANDLPQLVEVGCPACGSSRHGTAFDKSGFTYRLCDDCGTLFTSPRPTQDALTRFYTDSPSTRFWVDGFFRPMAEARRMRIFRPRAQLIADRFPELSQARVGDVGAGFGLFLEELRARWPDASLSAIEPSPEMVAICREKGLPVVESIVEKLDPAEHQFDLLTLFELFEHFQDPRASLKRIRDLLAPNGYLFLTTLNGEGFDIQLFWAKAKAVFPPHHLNFANLRSITTLLEHTGFEVIEASTPGELDWDIVEGAYRADDVDPGRFFANVAEHASPDAKRALQQWITDSGFSSHMRVIARKA